MIRIEGDPDPLRGCLPEALTLRLSRLQLPALEEILPPHVAGLLVADDANALRLGQHVPAHLLDEIRLQGFALALQGFQLFLQRARQGIDVAYLLRRRCPTHQSTVDRGEVVALRILLRLLDRKSVV